MKRKIATAEMLRKKTYKPRGYKCKNVVVVIKFKLQMKGNNERI